MKLALLQINPTVGDLAGNARLIAGAMREAGALGADLAVTPELALVGYLPRDLLLDPAFVARSWEVVGDLARDTAGLPPALVGLPEPNPSDEGRPLFNSAVLLRGGALELRFRKALLPTYDVFDEDRYFEPFHGPQVLELGGRRLGISICEDVWNDRDFWKRRRYHHDPIVELVRAGADAIVNLSASPFTAGKHVKREAMLGSMAHKHRVPVIYVNQYGGNDDVVFDGRSCAFGADGAAIARGRSFDGDVLICDIDRAVSLGPPEDVSSSRKSGARWSSARVTTRASAASPARSLGLSGGIDSALTAAIAAEALGADHVLGVLMPSPYSSPGSLSDACALAANLGIETLTLPIEPAMKAYSDTLREPFAAGKRSGRARKHPGAHSRQPADGAVEPAGIAAADDRQQVGAGRRLLHAVRRHVRRPRGDRRRAEDHGLPRRALAEQSAGRAMIPEATLTKAPSAELRPNQTDQDSLPPYEVLDDILQRYIEQHQSVDDIVAAGFDRRDRRARLHARAERRVQAETGGAGPESHGPGVRHWMADADCSADFRFQTSEFRLNCRIREFRNQSEI